MLIQYSVENYKSIKEEIIINFTAEEPKDKRWIIDKNNLPDLYKGIALIGPNASGKTNIIRSFMFALKFIMGTVSRKENSPINVEKFQFSKKWENLPTSFEFIFYYNTVKYVYGFSIDKKEIIEEYLMGYFTNGSKTFFERSKGQKYNFHGNDEKLQRELVERTNNNRLYMPVAAEWGYQPVKEAYDWFGFISRQYEDFDINRMIESILEDEREKEILIRELRNADFNIKDIYIKKKRVDRKTYEILEMIYNKIAGEMEEFDVPETRSVIHVIHENGEGEEFDIPLDEDSAGTSSIVQNIAELLYLSRDGGIIVEDELGKSFHTKLTQHFLEMVKSDRINAGGVQILFTSHDTKVLKLLNPDQIYLVDKDKSGATFVQLLSDYIIKDKDDIELGYLKGRYGGIPYMKG